MGEETSPNGLAIVDKPAGWTSHDVVAKCRGIFGTRKVGHSGTLDPMATGVLVLGVGRATKLLTFLSGLPKSYSAEITFGAETDSLDADGEVTATHPDMVVPNPQELNRHAQKLVGRIDQIPPMVSAIKVDGKRLHQLHREGRSVERKPRPVEVFRFDLEPTGDPLVWNAEVECGSGTYVRSLAADLGHLLGGGAHLSALRRTAVGPFDITEAEPMESAGVLPPSQISRVMPAVIAAEPLLVKINNGAVLDRSELGIDDGAGPWAVMAATGPDDPRNRPAEAITGDLVAVYEAHRGSTVKPAFVLGS